MRNFILRVIIYAVGVALVAQIVPGIHVTNDALGTLLIIGFVFGILNAIPNQFILRNSLSALPTKAKNRPHVISCGA